MTLSRVQSDLIAKIIEYARREELLAGDCLREDRLAKLFGVSRSPIRAALREMAESGLVKHVANKGHYLTRNGEELNDAELSIASPDLSLYDRIAADLMQDAVPEQFTEASFMRRYDVSRAQLTRTLTHMAHDGLVRRGTGYSWFFLPVLNSEEAHFASYRFRLIIEPSGLAEPTFSLDHEAVARSRTAHQNLLQKSRKGVLSSRDVFDATARFHEMLAEMSGNQYILQAIQQQNRLRRLSEYYMYDDKSRVRRLVEEHCAIMDALSADDLEQAATLLREHLEIASRIVPNFT